MRKTVLLILFSLMLTISLSSCNSDYSAPKGSQGDIGIKGEEGNSVESIILSESEEEFDIYTINYSDGTTSYFRIMNGLDGSEGIEGLPGDNGYTPKVSINSDGIFVVDEIETKIKATGSKGQIGDKGENGISVVAITKYKENENISYYMITYSNGDTSKFEIKHGLNGQNGIDGVNGIQGIQGEPGPDGHSPVIYINQDGYFVVDDEITNIVAKGYIGEKGEKGISILSIKYSKTIDDFDLYVITYDDGTTSMFMVPRGKNGQDGQNGSQGIQGIQGIAGEDGYTPDVSIGDNGNWFVDSKDTGKQAIGPKGETGEKGDTGINGKSVISIDYSKTEDLDDVYIITYDDGTTTFFKIRNGKDGLLGVQGDQGIQGEPGKDGKDITYITINASGYFVVDGVVTDMKAIGDKNLKGDTGDPGISVVSITLLEKHTDFDLYMITYSNQTTSKFKVPKGKNGVDAPQGIQGEPGKDGHTPIVKIINGYWYVDGNCTGLLAKGTKGKQGKSAYEIYIDSHPNYNDRGEQQWLDDLISGNLSTSILHKVSYVVDGEVVKTEMVKHGYNAYRPVINDETYDYDGWYYNGAPWFFEGNPILHDMELTGTRKKKYCIINLITSDRSNGKVIYFLPSNPISKLPYPDLSSYEGLEFLGYVDSNGNFVTDNKGNIIIKNHDNDSYSGIYYAKYKYVNFPTNANVRIVDETSITRTLGYSEKRYIDFKSDANVLYSQLFEDGYLEVTSSNTNAITVCDLYYLKGSLYEGTSTITVRINNEVKSYEARYGNIFPDLSTLDFHTKEELVNSNNIENFKIKGKVVKINDNGMIVLQDNLNIYNLIVSDPSIILHVGDCINAGCVFADLKRYYLCKQVEFIEEDFLTPVIDLSSFDSLSREQLILYNYGFVKIKGIFENFSYDKNNDEYIFKLINNQSYFYYKVHLSKENTKSQEEYDKLVELFDTKNFGSFITITGQIIYENSKYVIDLIPNDTTDIAVEFDDFNIVKSCLDNIKDDFCSLKYDVTNFDFKSIKALNPNVRFNFQSADSSIINVETGTITHSNISKNVKITVTATLNQITLNKEYICTIYNKVDSLTDDLLFNFDIRAPEGGYATCDFVENETKFSVQSVYFNKIDCNSGNLRVRNNGYIECRKALDYRNIDFKAKLFGNDAPVLVKVMYAYQGTNNYISFNEGNIPVVDNELKTYHVRLPIEPQEKVTIKIVIDNGNRISFDELRFYR